MPLVSIIVPIYKVEDCLRRCLDSICKQSLQDIEILLIDDASPDNCGAICEEYKRKDTRFHVFHNEVNRGLSVARNIGIEKATASFLMFVDGDDWVYEDFCKNAYHCAVHYQADLVMFRYQEISKNGKPEKTLYPAQARGSGYKTRQEALELLKTGISPAAWNKLYRKELFQNVFYPPGYFYEDIGTTYKLVWQATRIYYLDEILYNHCYREDSITKLKTKKALQDMMEMQLQQINDLAVWGYYPTEIINNILQNLAMSYCIKKKPDTSDYQYVYWASKLRQSNLSATDFTWKRNILLFLFKYFPLLFEFVCVACKKKLC